MEGMGCDGNGANSGTLGTERGVFALAFSEEDFAGVSEALELIEVGLSAALLGNVV